MKSNVIAHCKNNPAFLGGLYILFIIGIILIFFNPFINQEFDTDEGIQVAKAWCVNNGADLYSDIWADHPPLFTYIQSLLVRIGGHSIILPRLTPIIASFFILFYLFKLVLLKGHQKTAYISVSMLAASYLFVHVFHIILLTLMATAFLLPSIYYLLLYLEKDKKKYLLISAALLACSLCAKLVALYLAPMYFFLFFFSQKGIQQKIMSMLFFLGTLIFVMLLILLPTDFFSHLDMIFQRWSSSSGKSFKAFDNQGYIVNLFWQFRLSLIVLCLGVVLFFLKFRGQRIWSKELFAALGWLLLTLIVFLFQKPLWYHYVVLFSIPLTWLMALFLDYILRYIEQFNSKIALGITIIAIAGLLTTVIQKTQTEKKRSKEDTRSSILYESFTQYVKPQTLVFSDRYFFAFLNQNRIIPELALFTQTRFLGGQLSDEEFVQILTKYQPEYIVLGRYPYEEYDILFKVFVSKNYRLIHEKQKVKVFQRL